MVAAPEPNWKGPAEEPGSRPGRYPTIARTCFYLNGLFFVFWGLYAAGPDATGLLDLERQGLPYRLFSGLFFLLHFVLISTGLIALFVIIIEVYSRRPTRGLRSVLIAFGLPIVSFLYFTGGFLAEVRRWADQ